MTFSMTFLFIFVGIIVVFFSLRIVHRHGFLMGAKFTLRKIDEELEKRSKEKID